MIKSVLDRSWSIQHPYNKFVCSNQAALKLQSLSGVQSLQAIGGMTVDLGGHSCSISAASGFL